MGDEGYRFTTEREEFCKARGIISDWQNVSIYIEELETENQRLREALEKIASDDYDPCEIAEKALLKEGGSE